MSLSVPQLKLKLVVSDFHLGKGRYFRDGSANLLEDFVYDREFAEFLDHYRTGSFSYADVELVLNGDILNLLQMDHFGVYTALFTERSTERAVRRIAQGHPVFFEALKRWLATPGHRVAYVIGNHDVGMMWGAPQRAFEEACGGEVRFFDEHYAFDGVYIEHGQQHERFARIDPRQPFITRGLPEPVLNLPWGSLFVAAMLPGIKQERPHVDKVRPFSAFLIWALVHDFLWAVRTGLKIARFTLQTLYFKTRYRVLLRGLTWALISEITLYPNFDKIAFRLLEERDDTHTVIFGHTHILKYRRWREGKQYFNEGTWNEVTNLDLNEYGTRTRLTYAFIEYPAESADGRPHVRIKEWRGRWVPDAEIVV